MKPEQEVLGKPTCCPSFLRSIESAYRVAHTSISTKFLSSNRYKKLNGPSSTGFKGFWPTRPACLQRVNSWVPCSLIWAFCIYASQEPNDKLTYKKISAKHLQGHETAVKHLTPVAPLVKKQHFRRGHSADKTHKHFDLFCCMRLYIL